MRKRDKLRAKRDRAWEKMEDRHSQKKAEAGICMIIVMFFTMGIMATCVPDLADAKSRSSRSSSRSTKSYSAPKVRKAPVRKAPIVQKAPIKKAPISLSKRNVAVGVGAGVVTGAVVASQLNKDKQTKQKSSVKRTTPRKLKKGMYHKNGKVCKKTKYGREKCKSKAAYFFDDVLDADDWFEGDDDDDDYQQRQYQQQQPQQSSPFVTLLMVVWFSIMIFAVLVALFYMKRRK